MTNLLDLSDTSDMPPMIHSTLRRHAVLPLAPACWLCRKVAAHYHAIIMSTRCGFLRPQFAADDSSAEVLLGRTRVLTAISAQLLAPFPDRGNEGRVQYNVEFSPMASPAFEPGCPGAVLLHSEPSPPAFESLVVHRQHNCMCFAQHSLVQSVG